MKKVGFITLGCKVNIYESNALEQELIKNDYSICEPSKYCDVFIINTCSVTNTADQKSRQMISKARKLNQDAIVCVMGCYTQTSPKALDLDADIIIGNGNKLDLVKMLNEQFQKREKVVKIVDIMHNKEYENLNVTTYDHARAFVKIQDGCNQFCTYCIIPYARGPVRSKKARDVIKELNDITSKGYEEVVLSGIHTGKYKDDLIGLAELIELILAEVPLLKRLRISSIEMNEITPKLLELLKNNRVLADHFHIPLQSGNDKILKLMNRPYTTVDFKNKIEEIRAIRKDIAITADVIVGFPYETEEDFAATKKFIEEIEFASLHVFPYSRRDGTKAAQMPQVNGLVKKIRAKELIKLSEELEAKYAQKFIGQTLEVIFEQINKDGYLEGHTSNYLKVYTKGSESYIKKNAKVKLIEYKDGIIYADIIE